MYRVSNCLFTFIDLVFLFEYTFAFNTYKFTFHVRKFYISMELPMLIICVPNFQGAIFSKFIHVIKSFKPSTFCNVIGFQFRISGFNLIDFQNFTRTEGQIFRILWVWCWCDYESIR